MQFALPIFALLTIVGAFSACRLSPLYPLNHSQVVQRVLVDRRD